MNKFNVGDKVILNWYPKWVFEIVGVVPFTSNFNNSTRYSYTCKRVFDARTGKVIKGNKTWNAMEKSLELARDVFTERIITLNKMIEQL